MTSSQTGRSLRGVRGCDLVVFHVGLHHGARGRPHSSLEGGVRIDLLQAGLVQFAWFAAYGLLSIPGAI